MRENKPTIRCDSCGTTMTLDSPSSTPAGWWVVQHQGEHNQSEISWEFCSEKCFYTKVVERGQARHYLITKDLVTEVKPKKKRQGGLGANTSLMKMKAEEGRLNYEKVKTALITLSEPVSVPDLANLAEMNVETVRKHLRKMVEEGSVKVVNPGVKHSRNDARTYAIVEEK